MRRYCVLCLKKASRHAIAILVTMLALTLVLAAVAWMLVSQDQNDDSRQKVRVGIVGDLSQTYLGIGFETITQADDIGLSLDFVEMQEEEASRALKTSEISAYLVIPDNYVTDIVSGKDVQLSFYLARSTASAPAVLTAEIMKILSPFVTESERGIYALWDYHGEYPLDNIRDLSTALNITYIDTVLSRSDALDVQQIGVGSLSMTAYYICGMITVFLTLFGVAAGSLFADKAPALNRLLCARNHPVWQAVLCEYGVYLLMMVGAAVLMGGIGCVVCAGMGLTEFGVIWAVKVFLGLLPCLVMLAALQFFVFEVTDSLITGILTQFLVAAISGYVAGCFYPDYFFPPFLQTIAAHLPAGLLFHYLRDSVAQKEAFVLAECVLYTGVFLALSVWLRRRRLTKETTL